MTIRSHHSRNTASTRMEMEIITRTDTEKSQSWIQQKEIWEHKEQQEYVENATL